MKANEFVKEHGYQYTKNLVRDYPNHTHVTDDGRMFINENTCASHIKVQLSELVKINDLKRLVESHNIVDAVGGLDAANRIICDAFHGSNYPIPEGHEKLSLAIQDVELCHVD